MYAPKKSQRLISTVGGTLPKFMGIVKGRTAIRVLNKFRKLRQQPYWGNRFWARDYCVDTVGLHTEMIGKYVKYQDDRKK